MTSNTKAGRLFTHLSASALFYIQLSLILLLEVWEALSHFQVHSETRHARDKIVSRLTRPLHYLLGAEFEVSIDLTSWMRELRQVSKPTA